MNGRGGLKEGMRYELNIISDELTLKKGDNFLSDYLANISI